jgi:hypothetical protein
MAKMTVENYDFIYYLDHPHFTVGHVDQWGEQGFLLYTAKVYAYEEDRKNQCGTTHSPMTVEEFLEYAEKNKIEIPEDFMRRLLEVGDPSLAGRESFYDMQR